MYPTKLLDPATYVCMYKFKFDYSGPHSEVNSFCYIIYFTDLDNIFPDRNLINVPGFPFPNPRNLFQGHQAIIPCWVSTPNVTVRFLRDTWDPLDQEPLGPDDGVTWDPKQGFIIENPDRRFDGMHKCETEYKTIFFVFNILCKYEHGSNTRKYTVAHMLLASTCNDHSALE